MLLKKTKKKKMQEVLVEAIRQILPNKNETKYDRGQTPCRILSC